jgi:hypothetical protein
MRRVEMEREANEARENQFHYTQARNLLTRELN